MIPSNTHNVWKELVTGKKEHKFELVSAGMLINKSIRDIENNNNNPRIIEKSINELYSFFCKHENLLKDDIHELFN
jgi:hypothetical protein